MLIQEGKIPQRTYHVEWDAGVHFEFLVSIMAYCKKEHWQTFRSVEQRHTPFEELQIPEPLVLAMQEIHDTINWEAVLVTCLDLGPRHVNSVRDWLQWFDTLSPVTWYAGVLRHYTPVHLVDLETLELVIREDDSARERLLQAMCCHKHGQTVHNLLHMDETAWVRLKQQIFTVCEQWYDLYFSSIEAQMKELVEKGLDLAKRMTRDVSSEQCVFTVTRGIEYFPEPGVWTVRLVPQYHFRPFNYCSEYRDCKIFFFPVPDEVVFQSDEAALQELAQAMRCLGDENRLKILQFLKEGDKTFGEIVQYLSISKSTVHHHMVTLRSQGFVTIRQIGEDSKYQLRKERWTWLVQQMADKFGF
jgi:DNA-binding transcriptional ArsR family regulator